MPVAEDLDKQTHDATQEAAKDLDQPIADIETPDHERFKHPRFAHMALRWDGSPVAPGASRKGDALMMARIHGAVRKAIDSTYPDAYELLWTLYALVRTPLMDEDDDQQLFDERGHPRWESTAEGMPVEDWTRLGYKEREHYIMSITTRLFDWQQRATEAWAEAMFSKALWEEKYAIGYRSLPGAKATIEDRTAKARLESSEERYFALFKTYFSRQAQALVDSFELLNQRLKDLTAPNGNGRS